MRFCGCDTSVSSGSIYGCSVMMLVGDAAEVQLEGQRRPEPGRLYAAMQASSFAAEDATSQVIRCMQYRRGVESGGDVVAEGETRWALVYSDIKRCGRETAVTNTNSRKSRRSNGKIVRQRGVYSCSCVMSSMTITAYKNRRRGMGRRFADPVATLSAYSINRRRGKP